VIPQILKKRAKDRKYIPVPAVAGRGNGEYTVCDPMQGTAGTTSYTGRAFGVPLTNEDKDIAIRAHEYAHLAVDAITPDIDRTFHCAKNEWVQPVLDNIVNGFAFAQGVDSIKNLPMPKIDGEIPQEFIREIHAQRALQILSVKNKITDKVLNARDMAVLKTASLTLRAIGASMKGKTRIPSEVTDKIILTAKTLESYFGKPQTEREDLSKLDAKGSTTLPRLFNETPEWCDMEIVKPNLDKSISRMRLGHKRKAGFMGAFRNPLRALLPAFDGMAWDRKVPSIGGNILIDISGSMNLSSGDLVELLKTAPAATIAGYCSDGKRDGWLIIFAQNGRYASNPERMGDGNGVDGPALDWLARQRGPKVWICDGVVTGVGDAPHPLLTLECRNKCAENNILYVSSLPEYFRLAAKP
jgi:hypothetical protein